MHTRIPEMRDPSKWKFPKRGIPQFRNSKTRESIHFCSFLQEISSFYKCFFSTKLGFTISKFHRRISMFAVYVKYWTINHFSHSYKRRHLLAIFSSNPSFWKFPFWGIPHFRNFGTGMKQTGFFGGVLPVFCIVFCFFTNNLYVKCSFCKNNHPIWHSLARGAPIVKFRHI